MQDIIIIPLFVAKISLFVANLTTYYSLFREI